MMRSLRTWSPAGFPRTARIAILLASAVIAQTGRAEQWNQPDAPSGPLICSPVSLQFGSVPVGQENLVSATITNASESNVVISGATILGQDFGTRGLEFPLTLGPWERYTFTAVFAPHVAGQTSGSISLTSVTPDGASQILQMATTGTGEDTGRLQVGPLRINFGPILVGTRTSQVGTVTALGSAVTIHSVEISNSEFALSGLSFPVTIAAGETREFSVTFNPTSIGHVSGQILFHRGEDYSPVIQFFSGMGIGSEPHSVDLTWNPSISPGVVGYNIYRADTTGGPYTRLNGALDPDTTYTDNSVNGGATYYYVATAVNLDGLESAYSSEVQAIIPSNQ